MARAKIEKEIDWAGSGLKFLSLFIALLSEIAAKQSGPDIGLNKLGPRPLTRGLHGPDFSGPGPARPGPK